ncbi:hypothetical protein A0H81_05350 [Grifola frondosa]|uniref:Uncharacterized protein n=1 Tax=Grifola frondosa TaxID=5627 RepID=A0A1C7MD71_GRIFR|nr:hypothetical protein A0H81_05350 [Grifola frondosa]
MMRVIINGPEYCLVSSRLAQNAASSANALVEPHLRARLWIISDLEPNPHRASSFKLQAFKLSSFKLKIL